MKVLTVCTLFVAAVARLRIDPRTRQFVDEDGFHRHFHGFNVVVKNAPYFPSNGAFDADMSLNDDDMDFMVKNGFNAVRLGIMWPGIFPTPGSPNVAYLAQMKSIVNRLHSKGIYVILDLHQDLLSRSFCGEGVPDWLLNDTSFDTGDAFPAPLDDPYGPNPSLDLCFKKIFGVYYMTHAVSKGFDVLYNGFRSQLADPNATTSARRNAETSVALANGLKEYWATVAAYFNGTEGIIGYELFNEPWFGDIFSNPLLLLQPYKVDQEALTPMYETLHATIRKYDPYTPVFFEPVAGNEGSLPTGCGFGSPPYAGAELDATVYAYHVYCVAAVDNGDPSNTIIEKICGMINNRQVAAREADGARMGVATFVTEFGAASGATVLSNEYLASTIDTFQASNLNWVYWQFKRFGDFTTVSPDEGLWNVTTGDLQAAKLAALAVPFLSKVGGTVRSVSWDRKGGVYSVTYSSVKALVGTTLSIGTLKNRGIRLEVIPSSIKADIRANTIVLADDVDGDVTVILRTPPM